jgi:hypothetical protein
LSRRIARIVCMISKTPVPPACPCPSGILSSVADRDEV